MDTGSPRRCRHCAAAVPDHELACPGCGRYFDGGFDVPDLIAGIRAVQPMLPDDHAVPLDAVPPLLPVFRPVSREAEIPEPAGDGWWSSEPPLPAPRSLGQAHDVQLPRVGEVSELPYAADDDDEVIDLRDPPPRPPAVRSWRRSRTRT